jgi:hypothetical protein
VDTALERFGSVDVLVNGLGAVGYRTSFEEVRDDDWLWSAQVNLLAAVRLIRATLPSMRAAKRGSIINIASDTGRQPHPMFVDYSAMKAALLSITKTLSIEVAGPDGDTGAGERLLPAHRAGLGHGHANGHRALRAGHPANPARTPRRTRGGGPGDRLLGL